VDHTILPMGVTDAIKATNSKTLGTR
jgi:hypothetical protein